MTIATRLLASRLLTRSGDQAWDFAMPLTLVRLYPDNLRVAVAYYLLVRLGSALVAPLAGSWLDVVDRPTAVRVGISAQVGAMLLAVALAVAQAGSPPSLVVFAALSALGLVSSLGALVMEIAVANDLVPSAVPQSELPRVNGRLKQIDLATEVGSPIVAGLLLSIAPADFPLLGFVLIAAWNVVSFFPEYALLASVFRAAPALCSKPLAKPAAVAATLGRRLTAGWRDFFRQPVMPAMLAYALLWLSVLSPHGVILTAFLQGGWRLPETTIGVFRGLGALFGLAATYIYPRLHARLGLLPASRALLLWQAGTLIAAVICFNAGGWGQPAFLGLILLSRIGLYGFSLGETEIRQVGIAAAQRGIVNGFAAALTSVATLGLFGAGAVFTSPEDFHVLVYGSVACVCLGAVVFTGWTVRLASTVMERAAKS